MMAGDQRERTRGRFAGSDGPRTYSKSGTSSTLMSLSGVVGDSKSWAKASADGFLTGVEGNANFGESDLYLRGESSEGRGVRWFSGVLKTVAGEGA